MEVDTTRFGEIEVPEEDVFCFPEGVLGFNELREYALLKLEGEEPLLWLQSTDEAEVAFVVCDPARFNSDYRVRVTKDELASIELDNVSGGRVLVILTLSPDPTLATANLQGPLVFNVRKRLAKQIVVTGEEYTTKYRVFADVAAEAAEEGNTSSNN